MNITYVFFTAEANQSSMEPANATHNPAMATRMASTDVNSCDFHDILNVPKI